MELRLKELNKKIIKELEKELGRKNPMSLPKITRVVLNSGIGKYKDDKNLLESIQKDLTLISGQKPVLRHAKKSISNFKVREGEPIGISVTLRGDRMWQFMDKFFNVVLPRVRDFRGLSPKSFDGNGNYTVGLKEHAVFPEINPNTMDKVKSLEVTFVTSTRIDKEGRMLLEKLGMPFAKE